MSLRMTDRYEHIYISKRAMFNCRVIGTYSNVIGTIRLASSTSLTRDSGVAVLLMND